MTHSTPHHGPADDHDAASTRRWGVLVGKLTSSTTALHVLVLGLLAYLPSLTAAPGRMPTDTKLYLYLDPRRLTGDSLYSWDSRQFAGWVPHQTVSYLWPTGPWYTLFDWLGVPDWVAQRLWIGTLMFVAGLGVRWAAKLLGLAPAGALVAALFYQLSPYILPYISRTSTMLLPWAGLGWLIGLTIRAATRSAWRDVGIFGLVIATVAATNATAILMIAPAPVLWLLHAAWERSITWRTAGVVAAKIGGVSLVMSAWWISMLSVQSKYGADVLGYSETLEAVSLTSSSTEVVRGLGYWLFYVRDPVGFATTAAYDYMASGRLLAITFVVLLLAVVGLVATRWTSRRFAALLVFVGVVLAVGVHPIDDPSPLMSGLADNSRSSLALAMRSSTRALPLSTLGFALALGALATAVARARPRIGPIVPVALAVLAMANLPALFDGGFVDPNLERDEQPPAAWTSASAALDEMPEGFRVMQLPGLEFGAFRWGYTVDPPLPGLTDRPLVTRDLLPLGSAGAMDLLYALDDRFQEGNAEIAAVAPLARLFGVDTVWLPNDVAFDRFRTPRPEGVSAMFAAAADDGRSDLGAATVFGEAEPNVPVISMIDEEAIANASIGTPLPLVALVPVSDPQPIVRIKTDEVVVAGSGDGVVDAAAAGVLTGDELIRYAADLVADPETGSISDADRVVVTDSNRDRAHHWHSSQDVWGFTEDGSDEQGVLVADTSDQRIPVFPEATPDDRTIALQRGGTTARASNYGEPFAYRPESRAAMAVDGDLSTSWLVADRFEPIGERLQLNGEEPFTTIHLVQPQDVRNRWITEVEITDGSGTYAVPLTEESRAPTGQDIILRSPSQQATITISATATDPAKAPTTGADAVGFAEATTELGPTDEIVRVPSNVLADVTTEQDVDIVLTRLRTRPTNRWRADPEPRLVRSFTLADDREFAAAATVRLDRRASDAVVAALLGWQGTTADRRLTGVPAMGGWAATDGDVATQWVTPFGQAVGSTLTIPLTSGSTLDPSGAEITLQQPTAGSFNTITELAVRGDEGDAQIVAVPAPDASGTSRFDVTGLTGSTLHVTITNTTLTTVTDRRYAEQVLLPAAITEIGTTGVVAASLPDRLTVPCRVDMADIDGLPLSLAVSGSLADLFGGEPVEGELCDGSATQALTAGEHLIHSASGLSTGIDIDRVVLRSAGTAAGSPEDANSAAAEAPTATVVDNGRLNRTISVAPCPDGCWFVFGEGYNTGWSASIDDEPLGAQQQVDGGFNGWYLPPSTATRTIELTWEGQTRLTAGLVVSGLGVLLCLALIVIDRRRREPVPSRAPELIDQWIPSASGDRRFDVSSPGVIIAVGAVVVGGLVISPLWGAICGAVAVVCGVGLRRPQLLSAVAVAMFAVIALVMIRRYVTLKPFANAGWPGNFEDLHRPGMAAVVLLVIGVALGERRPPRSLETEPGAPDPAPEPTAPAPTHPESGRPESGRSEHR